MDLETISCDKAKEREAPGHWPLPPCGARGGGAQGPTEPLGATLWTHWRHLGATGHTVDRRRWSLEAQEYYNDMIRRGIQPDERFDPLLGMADSLRGMLPVPVFLRQIDPKGGPVAAVVHTMQTFLYYWQITILAGRPLLLVRPHNLICFVF
jgi:hypothetical protein